MTLAVILLDVLFILPPARAANAPTPASLQSQAAQVDNATVQTQQSTQTQSEQPQTQSQPGSTSTDKSSTNKPSATAPKTVHKATQKKPSQNKTAQNKKVESVNCNPAPAAGTSAPETSATGTSGPAPESAPSGQATAKGSVSGSAQRPANPPAPSNCPPQKPQKIVVDQGGTSEPSIQLAGDNNSAPLKGTNQCANAGQCLQSAQQNLQKVAGRQLTSSQHDMVTQIQQFMDQSKKASDSGDLESARTLAWKAQLLSEELVNPEK
jgi:hypothetical protein